MGYKVYGGDAQDAYAHSPPPETPTFVSIDDAHTDWYEHRFKKKLDCPQVLPMLHALQGHPESGKLLEKYITGILQSSKLKFQSTTHDCSIHSATIFGHKVLLLRQVDHFALFCPAETIACDSCGKIGTRLQLPSASESEPPFKCLGELQDFNGIDLHQRDDCIKFSCEKFIDRVLTTHGSATPSTPQPSKPTIHITTDAVTTLCQHNGPGTCGNLLTTGTD